MKPKYLIPAAFISLIPLSSLSASDSVTAGEFIVEPATFHNAGFEWKISGDDNRNATVSVRFREVGETSWREGQSLLRIGDERVWRAREYLEYWTPRMFAGSIFGLASGKTFECFPLVNIIGTTIFLNLI